MIHQTLRAAGEIAPLSRPALDHPSARRRFDRRRAFVPFALLLSILPLLWPTVPPLIDLLNSMSRYRIALDYGSSPFFYRWFDFHWILVGNLGVDLLVAGLAPWAGLEPATKLAVIAIPFLTVGGMALIAREIHGRVPPTAAFAFAFAYNFPFTFGFVNFCLSVGLALLVFGAWLRIGRLGRPAMQMAMLAPAGLVVWVAHACGWGMLGVMIFTAELAGRREAGAKWLPASARAISACLPLLLALVPMAAWASGGGSGSVLDFNFSIFRKYVLLMISLKNDVDWVDVGSVGLVFAVTSIAVIREDMKFDARLASVGLAMLVTFIAMPDKLMGSGFADLRIAPYALALLALAFRPIADTRFNRAICALSLCFLVGRTAYISATYVRLDRVQQQQFAALDHIPAGTRVFGLTRMDCIGAWRSNRMDHVNRMAIVRRQAFTNDTWPPTTASGLVVHPDMVAGYNDLDSQKLLPVECRFGTDHYMAGALAALPRDRFDYLWLIDVPARDWPRAAWLRPVWHGTNAVLYRIRREWPERVIRAD